MFSLKQIYNLCALSKESILLFVSSVYLLSSIFCCSSYALLNWTQSPPKLSLIPSDFRISSKEYNEKVATGERHVLIDVRPAHHYSIVSLPKSLNIPLASLEARLPEISVALKEESHSKASEPDSGASLYVVCRRGNDSQRAVQLLHKLGLKSAKDIIGGLESWGRDVDPNFPTY